MEDVKELDNPVTRKLVIDRKKWLRGDPANAKLFRSTDGKMCCLGFDLLDRGFTVDQISDKGTPRSVYYSGAPIADLVIGAGVINSTVCRNLMTFNDDDDLTDDEREAGISRLFRTIGVKVEFIN